MHKKKYRKDKFIKQNGLKALLDLLLGFDHSLIVDQLTKHYYSCILRLIVFAAKKEYAALCLSPLHSEFAGGHKLTAPQTLSLFPRAGSERQGGRGGSGAASFSVAFVSVLPRADSD